MIYANFLYPHRSEYMDFFESIPIIGMDEGNWLDASDNTLACQGVSKEGCLRFQGLQGEQIQEQIGDIIIMSSNWRLSHSPPSYQVLEGGTDGRSFFNK